MDNQIIRLLIRKLDLELCKPMGLDSVDLRWYLYFLGYFLAHHMPSTAHHWTGPTNETNGPNKEEGWYELPFDKVLSKS